MLLIMDTDKEYIDRLVEHLSLNGDIPMQIKGFSDEASYLEYVRSENDSISLISKKAYMKCEGELAGKYCIMLSEERVISNDINQGDDRDIKVIYKYQAIKVIADSIMEYLLERSKVIKNITNTNANIIGMYSPLGGGIGSGMSMAIATTLSRFGKVLYINVELYSSISVIIKGNVSRNISELLYLIVNGPERIEYKIRSLVINRMGFDIVPPLNIKEDKETIRGEEWARLIKYLASELDYTHVVVDMDDGINGLWDILSICDVIYTLKHTDEISQTKIEQYLNALESSEYKDIINKMVMYDIPSQDNPYKKGYQTLNEWILRMAQTLVNK